ncbi:unnamed protein product [Spirodela intermedia]|uniref:Uncharacterized protein n=1 Tax=Spirodela intermedia TaxID=51605 RepID=A0A7I8JZD2_SPIIN|nr:unnamed protein product [Spirodela intermedia]
MSSRFEAKSLILAFNSSIEFSEGLTVRTLQPGFFSSSSSSESNPKAVQSRALLGDGSWSAGASERKGCRRSCSHDSRSTGFLFRHLSRKSRAILSSTPPASSWSVTFHGGFPVTISMTVQPSDQTSDAGDVASPATTSGAIHSGVPEEFAAAVLEILLDEPKSASLASPQWEPTRTFRPLTSPWTTPTPWRYWRASDRQRAEEEEQEAATPPSSLTDFTAKIPPLDSSMARLTVPNEPLPMQRPRTHLPQVGGGGGGGRVAVAGAGAREGGRPILVSGKKE